MCSTYYIIYLVIILSFERSVIIINIIVSLRKLLKIKEHRMFIVIKSGRTFIGKDAVLGKNLNFLEPKTIHFDEKSNIFGFGS